jgi:peptide/nickel transport system substrate-binding protein
MDRDAEFQAEGRRPFLFPFCSTILPQAPNTRLAGGRLPIMKKLRWPFLIVMLALLAVAVLLYLQKPTALQPVKATQQKIEPVQGGIYTEALIGSFNRLNPLLDSANQPDRDVDRLLFSGLVLFDDRGLPQGDLADSWGISPDGLVYNFSLRANAVWHDGQPVTSDDVLFTIGLLRDEQSPLSADRREFWNQVEVERLDDKLIRFRLPEPFAPFLDYLTFGILPDHLLGDLNYAEIVNSNFNLQPVGSGPYRFEHLILENNQVAGVVLRIFDKYYGAKPYIDQITFRYYADAQAAVEAYRKGTVMGVSKVSTDILPEMLADPELNLYSGRLPQMSLIFLNLNNPQAKFLQEADVRRALLMGIDRQWIVDKMLNGQAIVANGPIFPGTWAYFDGVEQVGFDPEGAVAVLKKTGYTIPAEGGDVRAKEGTLLEFELVYPDDEAHAAIAEAIQQDWARLGVSAILKAVPYESLVSDYLTPRTYQAALVDLNLMSSPDPDPYPFWHQTQITNGQNYSNWEDHQASEYLEQARISIDTGERARLYRNFQVRFSLELPALPLYFPVYTYAISNEVQNVRMGALFDPSDRFNSLASWFLLSKSPAKPTAIP